MFKSLHPGEFCPSDETEWRKKSSSFNCSVSRPLKEYHCLLNNENVLGEICLEQSWVEANKCPVYYPNAGEKNTEPCNQERGRCPNKYYPSNEVYKYPGCLKAAIQMNHSSGGTGNSQPLPLLPIIVGGVIFVCLVVVITCIICLCRRRGSSAAKKEKDIEMQLPLLETFPSEFHKICQYLKANVFYPTKVYTKCVGLFEVHGSLLLIGPHGSGKTSIAVNLLSKKVNTTSNGKRCFVEVCRSVEEVADKIDDSTVTYVLLDDAMEQYAYQKFLLDSHLEIYEKLKRLIEIGHLRIICTVTDTTWNTFGAKLSQCQFFSKEFQMELRKISAGIHELEEIIKKHLTFYGFQITAKRREENLKRIDKYHSDNSSIIISEFTIRCWARRARKRVMDEVDIPLLFDLISTNRYLFVNVDNVLINNLESVLRMRISNLRMDSTGPLDKDFVSILTFTAFCGGKVSVQDFVDKESMYVGICSKIGCSKKSLSEIEGLMNMREMQGYLYPLTSCYLFHHKILTALILSSTMKYNEELVLQHADLDVLYRTLQPQKSRYPLCVKVSEKSLTSLVERISKETPDVIEKWCYHVIMQSDKVKKQLQKALKDCMDGDAQAK